MVLKLNLTPDEKMLRHFGLLCLVVFGLLSAVQWSRSGTTTVCLLLLSASIVGGVLGTLAPRTLRPIFVIWMIAAFPIGWVVSHLLLGMLFYGVFTPIGLLRRSLGVDSLLLKRPNAATFWKSRSSTTDLRRYFRQY